MGDTKKKLLFGPCFFVLCQLVRVSHERTALAKSSKVYFQWERGSLGRRLSRA